MPHRDASPPALPRRRQILGGLSAWSLTAAWPGAALGQAVPVTLGVLPNMSARVLALQYQAMRQFLEARLGRPVQMVTAPDFATFHARAIEGQYTLYVTAANLGALAVADGHGQPIGAYEPGIPALALAPRDRVQRDALASLRGRRVALANPASLVALRGGSWLHEKGLEEGRDYAIAVAPNEDSLARWLSSGDAPLALMSRGEFNQLTEACRQTLDVIEQFATVPGFMVMLPSRTASADGMALRQALQAFFASPALEAFSSATGVKALREVSRADLSALDAYLEPTRRRMAATR